MTSFRGFSDGKTHLTPLPDQFFHELLPQMDDLNELKLSLYIFWRLDQMEGNFRCLLWADFVDDSGWMACLGSNAEEAEVELSRILERAVQRGFLLAAQGEREGQEETFFFLNSPKGRAAFQSFQRGLWKPGESVGNVIELGLERPNIFRLYEEHIGPLTPLISEALMEAESSFPQLWIEEAFRIAVESNKRSWRYISAILRRWQEEGRDDRKDRRDPEKDRRRYIEGEFSDFIEH